MKSAPATALKTRSISHESMGVSSLFGAYVKGAERALGYYEHNPWTAEGRALATQMAAEYPRDRELLANALLKQNARWWGTEEDAVRQSIEHLRNPESVAVITGQQLGLFGGPLYTVYKALTAVKLAGQLESETGRPVVPVFWLADEDHDFAEVHATTLPNGAVPVRIAYEDGQSSDVNRGPIGRIVWGEGIDATVQQLITAFPGAPTWIRDLWKPGELWRDAFAHTLRKLTEGTGLVVVSGDDTRLKRLAAPLFRREIETWAETHKALVETSERLRVDGFHAQVKPGELNLFLFDDDGTRLQIDPDEEGFGLRGTTKRFSKQALLELLDSNPERFSPNVVLRPLMQDTLFPTAAYVGGPGEVAYFAQLKPVYEAFGVPMPVVYARASLTLISAKLQRFLDEYGLDLPDLKKDVHELHRRLALERSDAGLDGQFGDAVKRARALVDSLKPTATAVDASLDKAVEAAQARIEKALSRLEKKTVRAEKRNQNVILERLERLVGELMPGGAPQERVMSALTVIDQLQSCGLPELSEVNARHHLVVTR